MTITVTPTGVLAALELWRTADRPGWGPGGFTVPRAAFSGWRDQGRGRGWDTARLCMDAIRYR